MNSPSSLSVNRVGGASVPASRCDAWPRLASTLAPPAWFRDPKRESLRGILTRRNALRRLSAGALLALGLWPGSLSLKAKTGEPGSFKFIQVNDTHHMSPDCGLWLQGVVQQMKREGAEFCLLCGDLTEHGEREHLAAVRDIFQALGIPTYVQIGNHDHVTPTDRRAYEELYPDRLNYAFEHRGWQFVGLDSTEGQRYENTRIQLATFDWLRDHLGKLDPHKPTVLFTHFPLGEAVKYRPGNAEELLEQFKAINLKGVFNGHFHGFTEHQHGGAFVLTDRCCALKRTNHDHTTEKGYLMCEASDGKIAYRFVECPPRPDLSPALRPPEKAGQAGKGKAK